MDCDRSLTGPSTFRLKHVLGKGRNVQPESQNPYFVTGVVDKTVHGMARIGRQNTRETEK